MRKFLPWLLTLAPAVPLVVTACDQPDPDLWFAADLQAALTAGLDAYDGDKEMKGVSAAVIVPGYKRWVGVSEVSHGEVAITPDTPFGTGSVAMSFTAAAVLQLAEEGVLTLDDPISRWLPKYENVDGSISTRQLLNITSGLPDFTRHPSYWGLTLFEEPERHWTPGEVVQTFTQENRYPKGTQWYYSHLGYNQLRMIAQEATSATMRAQYEARFWDPLGLNASFTLGGDELPGNTAHGWFDFDQNGTYDEFPFSRRTALASGMGGEVFATARDLAEWADALYRDRKVVDQGSLNEMLGFEAVNELSEPLIAGYGLGAARFAPSFFNGLEVWGHSGNAPGYAAAFLYLPDYDVSIGIATNTEEGEAMRVINDLLAIITTNVRRTG